MDPEAAAVAAATGTGREAENAVKKSAKWALEFKWMIELFFGQAPSLFLEPAEIQYCVTSVTKD